MKRLRLMAALILALPVGAAGPAWSEMPVRQSTDHGASSDYCERQLGTWFYCRAEPAPQAAPEPEPPTPVERDAADLAEAEAFKRDMENARIIAVWNPTDANVRRFYELQQAALQKSGLFADTARRMVWADPSLDYTLQRPISMAAKSEWIAARNTDRDLFFRGVFDEIGLFYVYRQACAPCRASSPLIRQFGQRFGVTIKAISVDGSENPEFPGAMVDRGQLKAWGITDPVTPAYLIYQKPSLDGAGAARSVAVTVSDGKRITLRPCQNPKGCLTYLGAGVLSVDELADRLFVTLATRPGEDF